VHHGGQCLVVDLHQLGRIHRLDARFGDHRSHRMAGVQGDAVGERRAQRRACRLAIGPLEERRIRDMAQAVGLHVGHRIDRDDARRLLRPGRIDRGDARMRVRRAQHHHPGLARQVAVVAVEALADEQAVVLQALLRTRRAEACGGGVELRFWCAHLVFGW